MLEVDAHTTGSLHRFWDWTHPTPSPSIFITFSFAYSITFSFAYSMDNTVLRQSPWCKSSKALFTSPNGRR